MFSLVQFAVLSRLGSTSCCLVLKFGDSLRVIGAQKWAGDLVLLALNEGIYSSSSVRNGSYVGIFV